MLLQIDPQGADPLYVQVYQQIKDLIYRQELTSHSRLPSKRQLAQTNGISQNTVIKAYEQLIDEGYIYALERSGYFVSELTHLVHYQTKAEPSLPSGEDQKESWRYDLTRSNADAELFPFKDFRKLYRDQLREESADLLAVSPGKGLYSLRLALAGYLNRSRGVPCQADQLVLGPSSQYLFSLLLGLLDQGQVLGIEDPGYHSLNALFRQKGLDVVGISLDSKGASLEDIKPSRADFLYLTPGHQFPTGVIMPMDRRLEILDWASQAEGRYIIEDDYDSEFKYSGIPVPSLASLDQKGQVIYMGSLSRTLAPSLRMSYMVLAPNLVEDFNAYYSYLTPAVSTLQQSVLASYLESGAYERQVNTARSHHRKKRDLLVEACQRCQPDSRITGQEAGVHLLWQIRQNFDGEDFKEGCRERGINIKLLSDFSLAPNDDQARTIYLNFSSIPLGEIEAVVGLLNQALLEASC